MATRKETWTQLYHLLYQDHINYAPENPDRSFAEMRQNVDLLFRYAANLSRIAERQCNGYQDWKGNWDQAAADRDEKREARIQAKVQAIVSRYSGVSVIFNGDPRGYSIKLLGLGTYNTFGGAEDGYGIGY